MNEHSGGPGSMTVSQRQVGIYHRVGTGDVRVQNRILDNGIMMWRCTPWVAHFPRLPRTDRR
jgi:hypothetical protein